MSELPVELECPDIGGSSGIVDNHPSNLFVKRSGVTRQVPDGVQHSVEEVSTIV
ncbi:hypothetical protein E2C01_071455 [Portunus trituberculatus]|uniref:Uncharacterized protein n=1 Tax=Portunus trituberculatus TaxID=210409 RepID=A0A5B7I696_PORTR|nr:hypothetical protein [Portunus trituberculatus]